MTGPAASESAAAGPAATAILVPDIGAGEPIRLGQWLVAVGEPVGEGDSVVELLADGVLWNVPSPAAGTVSEHRARPDHTVSVGQTVGVVAAGA